MGGSTVSTEFTETLEGLELWRKKNLLGTEKLGFVPTMGALHDGHMALIRAAKEITDKVVVSIFVNPLQFGSNEDFGTYPRTLKKGSAMCEAAGVDLVFHPGVDEIYPSGQESSTIVTPPAELTSRLCGQFRPGHFSGVATVVNKLLNMVRPDSAFFGEKDYQQLQVIRYMAKDLNMPVKIVGVPTVRENSGLAMSSRNAYLSNEQQQVVPALYKVLCQVRDDLLKETPISETLERGRTQIGLLNDVTLQYLELCDAESLQPLTQMRAPMVLALAAKCGEVRLIDNVLIR